MMPGILPFSSYHPIWSPIAGEIHAVIWDGVGLGKVHVFSEEWAKTWVADCITEDQQQENLARVRLELGFPEDWTLGLIADNLPDDKRIRQASDMLHDWQPKLPELPLPPSHRSRFAAEKWAALAAVHDVFDLSGDKVLPWSLPEDDYDLLALTEWMRGNGGAFSLLMRRASELRDSDSSVILRWLADVSKDTPPKDKKSNDHSQQREPFEAVGASDAKSKGRRGNSKGKNKEPFDRTLFGWLKLYHKYGFESGFHNRSIGCREFAKFINEHPSREGYQTNPSAVSRFFESAFGNHKKYTYLCGEEGNAKHLRALEMKFEFLNGDMTNEGLRRLVESRISDRSEEAEVDVD